MNIEHSAWCAVVLSSEYPECDCGAEEQLAKERELQRLRRVEKMYEELKVAAMSVDMAFWRREGSMEAAMDRLSTVLDVHAAALDNG